MNGPRLVQQSTSAFHFHVRITGAASIHSNEIHPSSDVQTKLKEGMLPQRQFPPACEFLLEKCAIFLADRPSSFLVRVFRRLETQRSFRVCLAVFSRTVFRLCHDILPSSAYQRRFRMIETVPGWTLRCRRAFAVLGRVIGRVIGLDPAMW